MKNITDIFREIKSGFASKPLNFTAFIFPIIFVAVIVLVLDKPTLRSLEAQTGYWILLCTFVGIIACVIASFKSIQEFLKNNIPSPKHLILITVLAAVSTSVISNNIEARHRVQSDESLYLATAQNMYHNQAAKRCYQGFFNEELNLDCLEQSGSFKAHGQSLLFSLGMKFFGKDLRWIFKWQLVMYAMMIVIGFLAVYVWTKNVTLSYLSICFTALAPTMMFQFRSISVEPLYVFLSFLAVIVMKWVHENHEKVISWVLFGLILGFFAQTRQETLFCLFAFLFASLHLLVKDHKRFNYFTLATTIACSPVMFMISAYQGYGFQGGKHDAHGNFWENVVINLKQMTLPMKGDLLQNPFQSYFTWFALLGLVTLTILAIVERKHYLKWFIFLGVYHLQSYVIFENISGDFTISINQRYALVIIPTMGFLAGIFSFEVVNRYLKPLVAQSRKFDKRDFVVLGVLLSALCFVYFYHVSVSPSKSTDFITSKDALKYIPIFLWLTGILAVGALIWSFVGKEKWDTIPINLKSGHHWALSLLAIVSILAASYNHKPSFEANVMYNRNHLTLEEHRIKGWMDTLKLDHIASMERKWKRGEGKQFKGSDKTSQLNKMRKQWSREYKPRRLFVYSRPFHFIGYGISSLHYKKFSRYSEKERQIIMNDFKGEVYYVKGLDCWEKKTYHAKAVESRNAKMCNDFEKKFSLKEELNHKITNSYPLVIAKVLGKKAQIGANDIRVLSFGQKGEEIEVGYYVKDLNKIKQVKVTHKGREIHKQNLTASNSMFSFPFAQTIIGFEQFKIEFLDSRGFTAKLVAKDITNFDESIVKLTDLPIAYTTQSWAKAQTNKTVMGNPLTINGVEYANGFGVHAQSQIDFNLNSQYESFSTKFGMDDEDQGGDGVKFIIKGDGKTLFTSKQIGFKKIHDTKVNVNNVQVLSLVVDSVANKNYDHANWIQPILRKVQ